ncbi:Fbxo21 [Symbiodinium natans]|uniref:Fbxo21 protein n=1 Tax=Symbiodinium natans TaxID=878477 RepID=A0A812SWB8_9DINO|nr:Fbxo21 [Symbiodinium natans]
MEALEPLLPAILSFGDREAALCAVWIQCCRERWRFGALFQVDSHAAPGARDEASMQLWQRSVDESRDGVHHSDAFTFFLERSRQDAEVREWLESEESDKLDEIVQLGANALDVLLKMETKTDARRKVAAQSAQKARIQITDAWAVERWTHLLKIEPSKAATLEEGALILSQWGYPTADVSGMRATLEKLAQRAKELGAQRRSTGLPGEDEARTMITALNQALFDEYGLEGNAENYYDPENSLLHAVLARKKGIPISLCVVWAAVARRCGLECHPLAGMPQHVLIRVPLRTSESSESAGPAAMRDLYVDAFSGGKVLVWRELVRFLYLMLGPRIQGMPEESLLSTVEISPPVQLYFRMMRNLQNIYQASADIVRFRGIEIQMRALVHLMQDSTEPRGRGYRAPGP